MLRSIRGNSARMSVLPPHSRSRLAGILRVVSIPGLFSIWACTVLFASWVAAADTELLDVLLKNGVISRKQYGSLNRKGGQVGRDALLEVLRQNGAITPKQYGDLAGKPGVTPPPASTAAAPAPGKRAEATPAKSEDEHAAAKPPKVEYKGGLEWSSPDGNFVWHLGGRLHLDATFYDNQGGSEERNGVDIRRARIELEGTLYKRWMVKLDYEFAQTNEVKDGFRDAYIRYLFKDYFPDNPTTLTVGQFKEYFGLGSLNSSNHIPFVERALVSRVFHDVAEGSDGRRIGVGGQTAGNDFWTARAGVFGKSAAGDSGDNFADPLAVEGRVTISPVHTETRAVHVGAATNWLDVFAPDSVQFRQRPEARIGAQRYLDTGVIPGAQDLIRYGLELGGVYGPFWLQSEYLGTDVGRTAESSVWLQGWHVDVGWVITGESRHYDWINGVFHNPRPFRDFSLGGDGWGALEVAARYSYLDLSDQNVDGGRETDWTAGVNWFLNRNFLFKFDYTKVARVRGGQFPGVTPNEFLLRAQAYW
jgi:phosphate-selective porin OprO/OprP